jgi:hypothetical protein
VRRWCRIWECILQLALILWVVRVAVATTALGLGRWVPRMLGLLTFVAVLIAIWRSYVSLPILDATSVIDAVARSLLATAALVILGGTGFIVYFTKRPCNADLPGLRVIKPRKIGGLRCYGGQYRPAFRIVRAQSRKQAVTAWGG